MVYARVVPADMPRALCGPAISRHFGDDKDGRGMMRTHRPQAIISNGLRLAAAVVVIVWTSSAAYAAPLLIPGGAVGLPGSTAAAHPELAGLVVHDQLIPFQIKDANGRLLCQGRLQDRVVRSNRGNFLHFYYRIRDMAASVPLPGAISRVETISFAGAGALHVDFRPDGLGVVAPRIARRSAAPGPLVEFDFRDPPLRCGGPDSRFFFIETGAKAFNPAGKTRLVLSTGQSVTLDTVRPL
jgi:hypothetical protein